MLQALPPASANIVITVIMSPRHELQHAMCMPHVVCAILAISSLPRCRLRTNRRKESSRVPSDYTGIDMQVLCTLLSTFHMGQQALKYAKVPTSFWVVMTRR